MAILVKKRSKKTGLPPGTLVHVGEKKIEKVKITIMDYDSAAFQEKEIGTIEEAFPFKEESTVTWINVDGLHQVEIIEKIGKHFDLHPLTLEDVVNTEQRPKLETFDNYLFIVLKMPYCDAAQDEIVVEQISVVLTPTCVISFQEREGDVFDPIRERIRGSKGRIRRMGPDFLAYSLIDAIVDSCFAILEGVGERVEVFEEELVSNPLPDTLRSIHGLKRELILLRKSMWPLREAVNGLVREESPLIKESTKIYLRDVYDHCVQVIDTIETFRDVVSGILDIYLSPASATR